MFSGLAGAGAPKSNYMPVNVQRPQGIILKQTGAKNVAGDVQVRDMSCAATRIQLVTFLASGSFGEVWKGYFDGKPAALKFTKSNDMKEFIAEAQAQTLILGRQIVQLYGYVIDRTPYCIILEYCPNGDLYSALHDGKKSYIFENHKTSNRLTSEKINFCLAIDIAEGLVIIHTAGKLHRDMKTENILLDADLRCKIADFGLCIDARQAQNEKGLCGTPAYIAPEIWTSPSTYTDKGDVYAFGVILWEIFTRQQPWPGSSLEMIKAYTTKGQRPVIPATLRSDVSKLINECLAQNPLQRPSMRTVLVALQKMYLTVIAPQATIQSQPSAAPPSASKVAEARKKYLMSEALNGMTDAEKVAVVDLFLSADVDCSGGITREELWQNGRRLHLSASTTQLSDYFNLLDANNSGDISFTEYVNLYKTQKDFQAIDTDGSGLISYEELLQYYFPKGTCTVKEAAQVHGVMQLIDKKSSGAINEYDYICYRLDRIKKRLS